VTLGSRRRVGRFCATFEYHKSFVACLLHWLTRVSTLSKTRPKYRPYPQKRNLPAKERVFVDFLATQNQDSVNGCGDAPFGNIASLPRRAAINEELRNRPA